MKLRWFQFRMRTLFIAVTLFAFPSAWLGHEYRIVQERKDIQAELARAGIWILPARADDPLMRGRGGPSWLRRTFGDKPARLIFVGNNVLHDRPVPDEQRIAEIERAFPEAIVTRENFADGEYEFEPF